MSEPVDHTATPEFIAGFYNPPLKCRVARFGIDLAAPEPSPAFTPQFWCPVCGPTNRVCSGAEGFICIQCDQAAAYRVFDSIRFITTS